MKQQIAQLVSTLTEKKAVLGEVRGLLEQEQAHLLALDLEGIEGTQRALAQIMERVETMSAQCRSQVATLARQLGVPEPASLTPVMEKLPPAERAALKSVQEAVNAESKAVSTAVELHRGLLQDSLRMVNQSVNFFNRLFNPGDTYGNAGSLVSRRGGSRFVCKEI